MTTQMSVANEIRAQLGRHFALMTGARQFTGGENWLSFKMPSNFAKNKANFVKITLTHADGYTVEFKTIRSLTCKDVSTHEGIYCDQLHEVFERETGLVTTMPRVQVVQHA